MTRSRTVLDLHLQDAGADAGYLLESLLDTCVGASRGGAIFAWANSAGARALLDDETFRDFAEQGTFDLVVGVDSITDEAAVEILRARARDVPNVTIKAFVHRDNALFHPKLAWFASEREATLIVGSGNLTRGGLTGNWEAFAVVRVTGRDAERLERQFANWLAQWRSNLLPIDDPRIDEYATRNTGRERDFRRLSQVRSRRPVPPSPALSVLIAEIPKAGTRWAQANFDLDNYEQFFGASVGTQRRVILYAVASDGSIGELESRPSVEVASHNYRFELAAAKGHPYPSGGRPIAVFVRLDSGPFLYELLLPSDADHRAVSDFLDARWSGSSRNVKRLRTSVAELRASWPASPLWTVSVEDL